MTSRASSAAEAAASATTSPSQEPAPKRVKTADDSSSSSFIKEPDDDDDDDDNDDLKFLSEFIQDDILKRRDEFKVGFSKQDDEASASSSSKKQPYPHVLLPNLLHDDFVQNVQTQVKLYSQVNFKESDLFRVYQSMDLANLKPPQEDEQKAQGIKQAVQDEREEETTPNKEPSSLIDTSKIPAVMKLRRLLYSREWRHFVEHMVGLPRDTLTDEVDCAFNCHAPKCHLLCHDDVIGTRKVSYILYLTDPSWTALDGGGLELYGPAENDDKKDSSVVVVPATIPSKVYLPLWNHMAFFVVEPGMSFHAVQEVLGDRPRLSLQGWYHYQPTSENGDSKKTGRPLATLEQLKQAPGAFSKPAAKGDDDDDDDDDGDKPPYLGEATEGPFVPIEYPEQQDVKIAAASSSPASAANDEEEEPQLVLSDEDSQYLSQYLNATYLTKQSMQDICTRFVEHSSVQLRNFLNTSWMEKINKARGAEDERDAAAVKKLLSTIYENEADLKAYHEQGTSENWTLVGPSHKQRFLEYQSTSTTTSSDSSTTASTSMGEILLQLRRDLLQHASFQRFLACLTNLSPPLAQRGKIRRFRKGLDYTVAHHGLLLEKSILDATLCFVAGTGSAPVAAMNRDDEDMEMTEEDEMDAVWQSGDCGGFECYIEADDDEDGDGNNNEAFAEYKASGSGGDDDEDDTELLSVSACNNTLSLVYRDPGTMRFVKYVGASAPSSRWDAAMEYLGDDQDDDDGDDDHDVEQDEDDDEQDEDDDAGMKEPK